MPGKSGLVPAPISADQIANKFLNADGTWSATTIITDFANNLTFTPNAGAFGTVSNKEIFYRRIGDSMEARGIWTTGTAAGATAALGLPLSIDNTKISNQTNLQPVGFWTTLGTNNIFSTNSGYIFYDGSDVDNLYFAYAMTTSFTKVTGSGAFNSNSPVIVSFTLPISGWSA